MQLSITNRGASYWIMNRKIDPRQEGLLLILDFHAAGIGEAVVSDLAEEFIPILEARLRALLAFEQLESSELAKRQSGILAQNMICQASVNAALGQYELLAQIILGEEKIADHGFPEFQSEE
jgi:hypothetical protein